MNKLFMNAREQKFIRNISSPPPIPHIFPGVLNTTTAKTTPAFVHELPCYTLFPNFMKYHELGAAGVQLHETFHEGGEAAANVINLIFNIMSCDEYKIIHHDSPLI